MKGTLKRVKWFTNSVLSIVLIMLKTFRALSAHQTTVAPAFKITHAFPPAPSFSAALAPKTRISLTCVAHLPSSGTFYLAATVSHTPLPPTSRPSVALFYLSGIHFLLRFASQRTANFWSPSLLESLSGKPPLPIPFQMHPSYPPNSRRFHIILMSLWPLTSYATSFL